MDGQDEAPGPLWNTSVVIGCMHPCMSRLDRLQQMGARSSLGGVRRPGVKDRGGFMIQEVQVCPFGCLGNAFKTHQVLGQGRPPGRVAGPCVSSCTSSCVSGTRFWPGGPKLEPSVHFLPPRTSQIGARVDILFQLQQLMVVQGRPPLSDGEPVLAW